METETVNCCQGANGADEVYESCLGETGERIGRCDYGEPGILRPEATTVMKSWMDRLVATGMTRAFLKPGDSAPNFTLTNTDGRQRRLSEMLRRGPVLLMFYHGYWCPHCHRQLSAIEEQADEIRKAGVAILAVSPQTPDYSLATREAAGLTFDILSDVGNQVAHKFGVAVRLSAPVETLFESLNIYLSQYNGDDSNELPVPVIYVIESEGKIRCVLAASEFTGLIKVERIIQVLSNTPDR